MAGTKKVLVSNGVDPSKLWTNISEGEGDQEHVRSIAPYLVDVIKTQIKYLKGINLQTIKGGAKALWENISKGNWGFLQDWFTSEETPTIAKVSGVGSVLLGGFLAGKAALVAGGKLAATAFGKLSVGFSVGTLWYTREQFLEKGFNFVETAVQTDFNRSTNKFIQDTLKKMRELLKSITTDVLSVSGRTLARVVVDQVGKPYLEVDKEMLGILTLTMSEEVMNDIRSSLAGIASQLWSLAKNVASQGILYMGRDLLADWGIVKPANDKEEFTLSDYINKSSETIAESYGIPDWLQESFSEAGQETYDVFKDSVINRGALIDQRRMSIRYI